MYLVYLEHGVPYPIGGSNDPWTMMTRTYYQMQFAVVCESLKGFVSYMNLQKVGFSSKLIKSHLDTFGHCSPTSRGH